MRPPPKVDDEDLQEWLEELWKLVELSSGKRKTGTYTGDGATALTVTGGQFDIKYLRIWTRPAAEAVQYFVEILDQTWGVYAMYGGGNDAENNLIAYDNRVSLSGPDFIVDDDGADAHPNKDGQVYDYLILG